MSTSVRDRQECLSHRREEKPIWLGAVRMNMSRIDWLIMALPMAVVCLITYKTNRYVKSVADFLAAGRVAGRYLVCTASGMAAMGVISVVAVCERNYKVGFAVGLWGQLATPVWLLMTLTGFVAYRYRETRALTLAQVFEMRYSRRFRIFAGVYGVMAWQGAQGFNCSAASAHEQKMGGILGNWRGLVFEVMQKLLAICALTYMTHHDFSDGAQQVTHSLGNIHDAVSTQGAAYLQEQMRVRVALAHFLPIGIKGIFAAIMFFLACTNGVSYLHSWGSIVAQDVILPLRNKPLSPKAHLLLLRCSITGVTIFSFCWSLFARRRRTSTSTSR